MDRSRWLQLAFGVAAAALFLLYVAMSLRWL
jgi:hypothetical protein